MRSQGIIKVIRIYHLGTINVCAKFLCQFRLVVPVYVEMFNWMRENVYQFQTLISLFDY